jgi:putative phosphoribosyl transferase
MLTSSHPALPDSLAVQIPVGTVSVGGKLALRSNARGLVIVANGDGDHIYDHGNAHVAAHLHEAGFSTLVIDLLTAREAAEDAETSELRFHQSLLAARLVRVTKWARAPFLFSGLGVGVFASGLCAGAALAAASVTSTIRAAVCRGARVDLVVPQLHRVRAEVLLIVGERDRAHLTESRGAYWLLPQSAQLEVLPNAGHLLDEPDMLDRIARDAENWFARTLNPYAAQLAPINGVLAGVP